VNQMLISGLNQKIDDKRKPHVFFY